MYVCVCIYVYACMCVCMDITPATWPQDRRLVDFSTCKAAACSIRACVLMCRMASGIGGKVWLDD